MDECSKSHSRRKSCSAFKASNTPIKTVGSSANGQSGLRTSQNALFQKARVIRPNLVYAINLPEMLAQEELLRSPAYFGQYGEITKLVINKGAAYHSSPGKTSFGVYITYAQEEQAALCIKACHSFALGSHVLNVTYGTTKFCSFFLAGTACPKPNCTFLHEWVMQTDVIDRAGLPVKKHIQPANSVLDKLNVIVEPPLNRDGLPSARVLRDRTTSEVIDWSPTPVRKRFYSKDNIGQSRFCLLEDSEEEPLFIPEKYMELCSLVKPSQNSCELPSYKLDDVFTPTSPDRWAVDVMRLEVKSSLSYLIYPNLH